MSQDFDPREYWQKRLSSSYDLEGVGYRGVGVNYNRWLYRVRTRVFKRMLRNLTQDLPTARVLDIGSGTGFYLNLWKLAGVPELVGSDITPIAVERLRERYPDSRIQLLDIGEAKHPLVGEEFDIVSAFDVLFHIVDDGRYQQAMKNIHLLLRDQGWFIFSDNFLHGPSRRKRHIVSRSLAEIESAVTSAGFEIVLRRPMFVLMNAPVDAATISQKKRWSNLKRWTSKSDFWGTLLGACLYPIELSMTAILKESPSTEIMVCRKQGQSLGSSTRQS